ncbi:Transcription initiation protein SPT3-like protein, partial [Stegodyphus mimosarum]
MVIYGMDFGGNSSARNRFKDIILNAHQQQRTRDLSVTEIGAQRRRQLITLHRYIPVFYEEIRSMMYTFGNCQEPLAQSVYLVEKILRDQMNKLLCKATEAAFTRGGHNISHEDLLFVIRKNRIVVKRLMQYLEIMDMKAVLYRRAKLNLDTAYPGQLPRGLRVKVCLAFLDYLDESGALGSVLDEYVDDPVGNERMLRRNRMTLRMSTEEYMKFSEMLSASFFPGGKAEKFKGWLLKDNVTPLLPTKLAVEIINFLARETVAQIVDLSLQVKKQAYSYSLAAVSNISKSIEESFEDTDGEDFQDINGEESDDSPVTDNTYLKSEARHGIKSRDSGTIDMADGESDSSSESVTDSEHQEYDENSDTESSSNEENPNKGSSDESSDELSDNHVTDDDETESEDNSSDNEDAVDGKKIIGNKDVSEDENMSDNDEDNASNDEDMVCAENVSDSDEDNAFNVEEIAGAETVPNNDEDSASSNEDIADAENLSDKDENNAFWDEDIAGTENVPDNEFDDGDIADAENVLDNASNVEDIAATENVPDNDEDNASNDEDIVDAENVRDNEEDNVFNDEDIAGVENLPDNDDDNAFNDEDIAGAENIPDNAFNYEDIADAEDGSGDENNESSDENTSNDETASSSENSENSSYDEECDSEEEEAIEENKEDSDENECEDSSDEKSEDTSEDSMNESEEDSTESSDSSQNNSKENSPEAKLSDEDFDNKGESSCLLQRENISGKEKLPEAEDFHETSVVPESDEVCQKEDSHYLAKTDYIFSLNEPGISDISDAEFPDAGQKLDVKNKQACDTRIEKNNIQEEIPVETTVHGPSDLNIVVTYEKPSAEIVSESHFTTEDTEKASNFQGSGTEKFQYETVEDFECQPYSDGEAQSVLVKPTDVDIVYEEEIEPSNSTYIPNASTVTETYEEMDASQSDSSSTDTSSSASEPPEEDTDSDPVPSPQAFYRQSFKPYPFTSSKFPTPVFSHDPELEDTCSFEDQLCREKLPDLEPFEREPITPYDIEEAVRRFHMPVQPALFFKMNPQCKDNE